MVYLKVNNTNFETSRRINYIFIGLISFCLIVAIFREPEYWPIFVGLLVSTWLIVIYMVKTRNIVLSFQYGILRRRTLIKEYVYDIREFSSIRVHRDSEGTDWIYGVKLVDGKIKSKKLCFDVYSMKLTEIQSKLNAFLEQENPIDELEKEQMEHEISVVLYQTASSIMIMLSVVMNFAFLFVFQFQVNFLIGAVLSGILIILYTIQSREIARNNLLGKIYTVLASLIFGLTFINFITAIQ